MVVGGSSNDALYESVMMSVVYIIEKISKTECSGSIVKILFRYIRIHDTRHYIRF